MSKKIIRSPSYPSLSLEDAVEAVGRIESTYRTDKVDRENAAKLIGFSGLSGPANKALAALTAYGLLERAGKGDTRVTERARAILHPSSQNERLENLMAAASSPPLFQKLRQRFPSTHVPPEEGVLTHLNREGFNPNSVPQAARAFLNTAEYLEKEGANDSDDTEPSNAGESPSSGDVPDTPTAPRIGDFVQWESQGALKFTQPRRVRAVSSEDGGWIFVDGSKTGVPMNEVTVERRESQARRPPTLPLGDEPVTPHGEIEWLRSRVGKDTSIRLMVVGDVGPREVSRLIRILETQRDVLQEEDDDSPI